MQKSPAERGQDGSEARKKKRRWREGRMEAGRSRPRMIGELEWLETRSDRNGQWARRRRARRKAEESGRRRKRREREEKRGKQEKRKRRKEREEKFWPMVKTYFLKTL